jgi:hypothetical protein
MWIRAARLIRAFGAIECCIISPEDKIMWICPKCNQRLGDGYELCWRCLTKRSTLASLTEDESKDGQPTAPPFASLGALNKRQTKSRKKLWIIVSLVVVMLAAREGGFVNWYCYAFDSNSKMLIHLDSSYYIYQGDKVNYTEAYKNTNYTGSSADKSYGVSFNLSGESNIFSDLKEQLQADLQGNQQLSAYVDDIEISGLYWLPLYKGGQCKYQLRVRAVGANSIIYTGNITGETDFSVTGACSIRMLKEILSKKIAEQVIKSVSNNIKDAPNNSLNPTPR